MSGGMVEIMDKMENCINECEENLIHAYNRYQIVIDKGEGVYLYDTDGKEYLDFVAGIAVFALGYKNEKYNNALKEQIDKIIHISNYFYSEPLREAAAKLTRAAKMDEVFFTNSGAEAIEGAIKLARKYGYLKDKDREWEIISMNHSFHGRSTGALSVTGNAKYQEPFKPLMRGIVFAEYNDIESVKAKINENTCAIIMETVQGEGGIHPAKPEFIEEIRRICDEKDILMICDEIQCGMGRCLTMFAYEDYGILPDVVAVAKALGCGVPVGAFLTRGKADKIIAAGDHGSTYGGNPLVCAAVSRVFELYEEEKVIENVNFVAPYLWEKLEEIAGKYSHIKELRGKGLMLGLEFDCPVAPIIAKAMEKGLILISAGTSIIRFVPPLIIKKDHVDKMAAILDEALMEVIGV